ncbi:hypothetical protein LMG2828_01769 [Achromobacter piechaudii]|uniref:hypothetical protein n=1 Tax=Achromobacter piechaudii TaxID=72556 RepID=UPI0014677F1E|nr:hypothetical protein [Achromobacter piechaudii]CAB3847552.1 hypothetical protein LMG2828_01769 [Achromobacter piechaudii]
MIIKSVVNPAWGDAQQGAILVYLEIEGIGTDIPFTASPLDPEAHGRELHARAVAGEFGPIAPYVAPRPSIPQAVTKYQCCVVLARHGLLVQTNAYFAAMAADDVRRLAWEMASTVQRYSESTLDAIGHLKLSEAQADALFIEADQVA